MGLSRTVSEVDGDYVFEIFDFKKVEYLKNNLTEIAVCLGNSTR